MLAINEETVEYIKFIFELYLQGESIINILHEMDKREILFPMEKMMWEINECYV